MATTYQLFFNQHTKANQQSICRVVMYDRLFALLLIGLLFPVWLVNLGLGLFSKGELISRKSHTDAIGREYEVHVFNCGWLLNSLSLLEVAKGDVALVGLSIHHRVNKVEQWMERIPPGLISLIDIHSRVGLSEESHTALMIRQQSYSSLQRCKLLVHGFISLLLYGRIAGSHAPKISLFGIPVNNLTMMEAVSWVCKKRIRGHHEIGYFVNVNSLNIAVANPNFSQCLLTADKVFADGSGVRLAAAQAGCQLKANVNGTDLLPRLCERMAKSGQSIYLLGAAPDVAAAAAENLIRQYPGLTIAGVQDGYFEVRETSSIIEEINQSRCDLLLVAFGSPLQESWLKEYHDEIKVPCSLAVGGLLDFYAGAVSRAPTGLRAVGMEWVWRLMQEPSRMWRRYILGNPVFLYRVYFQSGVLTK